MGSERPSMMEKQNSVTMEYFLETSHLDADTAALLKKYDKDGNGSFSKDEVAAIIMDLREAMRSNQELGTSNKLFKRLLIASCVFCVLLLASMFGLSYAVAALTAKTDVDASGALTKAGSSAHVSTDSRAEVHSVEVNEEGLLCVTREEVKSMTTELQSGKNVMLETIADGTTTVDQVSGNGMSIHETVSGKVVCMDLPNGMTNCFFPTPKCNDENSSGRRKLKTNAERRGRSGQRELSDQGGGLSDSGGGLSDSGGGLSDSGGGLGDSSDDDDDDSGQTCSCGCATYKKQNGLCPCDDCHGCGSDTTGECYRRYRKL